MTVPLPSNAQYSQKILTLALLNRVPFGKFNRARIGVRRDPENPDKKQKTFGYNLVLSTSVELHLKIELPVAVTNIAGNAEEGSQLIQNKNQIHNHHHCQVKIDIADFHPVKYWLYVKFFVSTTNPSYTPSRYES